MMHKSIKSFRASCTAVAPKRVVQDKLFYVYEVPDTNGANGHIPIAPKLRLTFAAADG